MFHFLCQKQFCACLPQPSLLYSDALPARSYRVCGAPALNTSAEAARLQPCLRCNLCRSRWTHVFHTGATCLIHPSARVPCCLYRWGLADPFLLPLLALCKQCPGVCGAPADLSLDGDLRLRVGILPGASRSRPERGNINSSCWCSSWQQSASKLPNSTVLVQT